MEFGERAQWQRAHTALAEDWVWFPVHTSGRLTVAWNSGSSRSSVPFRPLWAPACQCAHCTPMPIKKMTEKVVRLKAEEMLRPGSSHDFSWGDVKKCLIWWTNKVTVATDNSIWFTQANNLWLLEWWFDSQRWKLPMRSSRRTHESLMSLLNPTALTSLQTESKQA